MADDSGRSSAVILAGWFYDGATQQEDSPMTTKVSEQLLLAKSFIDTPEKWCRGDLHTKQEAFNAGTYDVGAHCTLGALQCAHIDDQWTRERLFNAMLRTLPTHKYVDSLIRGKEYAEEELEAARIAAYENEEACNSDLSDFWDPDYEDVIVTLNDYDANDKPYTTHEHIMQVFDAAILDAVAEELGLLPPEGHK